MNLSCTPGNQKSQQQMKWAINNTPYTPQPGLLSSTPGSKANAQWATPHPLLGGPYHHPDAFPNFSSTRADPRFVCAVCGLHACVPTQFIYRQLFNILSHESIRKIIYWTVAVLLVTYRNKTNRMETTYASRVGGRCQKATKAM